MGLLRRLVPDRVGVQAMRIRFVYVSTPPLVRLPAAYRAIARHSRRASSLIGNFVFGAAFSAAACDPS
jgi:hypothetical protein